jgi:hypothetical protein
MKELKDEEPVFLRILMSLHYSSQLNALFMRAPETDGGLSGLPPGRAALSPVLGKKAPNDAHTLGPGVERRGLFF